MEQKTITIKGKVLHYYPRKLTNDGSEPRLDIPIAKDNLFIFKSIADKHNLPFILMYGTLLGAVREHSFLEHDSDTDLGIYKKHEHILLEMIPELEKMGLLFIRYTNLTLFGKGDITYSFMKNGMYIDIYIMQRTTNSYIICGIKYPKIFFDNTHTILFYDHEYQIPYACEDFLVYAYGANWETPKLGNHTSAVKQILRIRFCNYIIIMFSEFILAKNILKKIARFMGLVT